MKNKKIYKKFSVFLGIFIISTTLCSCSKNLLDQTKAAATTNNTLKNTAQTSDITSSEEIETAVSNSQNFVNENFYRLASQSDIMNYEDKRYSSFIENKGGTANNIQIDDLTFYWCHTGFSTIVIITNLRNGFETIVYNKIENEHITSVTGYSRVSLSEELDPYNFIEYETYSGAGSSMVQRTTILCCYNEIISTAFNEASITYDSNETTVSKSVSSTTLLIPPFEDLQLRVTLLDNNTGIIEENQTYWFNSDKLIFEKDN